MASCLLTDGASEIENVPKIADVSIMAKILEVCGAKITGLGTSRLTITPGDIKSAAISSDLTEKLRASILFLGPLLARTGMVKMGYPGGDIIGRRPLGAHVQVMKALGAKIEEEDDFLVASAPKLKGAEIFLEEASVTATENALMIAVLAEGITVIKRAACEPHIVDLCQFLVKMGAQIEGITTNVLKITGVSKLTSTSHVVRPDHIEIGTFAILAALTRGTIEISPIIKEDLNMILLTLAKFGVAYQVRQNTLIIKASQLKATEKVVTDIWPGFPTDLMAPMIVLATQAEGATILHDWMYESRMFFVDKLISMSAKIVIADPHRVLVYGPTKLHSQRLDTPDIRAGIALVIAALIAHGQSTIEKAELVERGYENIVERLAALGAKIIRAPHM